MDINDIKSGTIFKYRTPSFASLYRYVICLYHDHDSQEYELGDLSTGKVFTIKAKTLSSRIVEKCSREDLSLSKLKGFLETFLSQINSFGEHNNMLKVNIKNQTTLTMLAEAQVNDCLESNGNYYLVVLVNDCKELLNLNTMSIDTSLVPLSTTFLKRKITITVSE